MGVAPLGLRRWGEHRRCYKHTAPLGLLSVKTESIFIRNRTPEVDRQQSLHAGEHLPNRP